MKNGNLSQFLDTGWYMESVVFYNGYVYWCEGTTSFDTNVTTFFVDKWRADCDGKLYHQFVTSAGDVVNYERVFETSETDMDEIKKRFLTAPIFDEQTFWDVENNLIWVDEGDDVIEY